MTEEGMPFAFRYQQVRVIRAATVRERYDARRMVSLALVFAGAATSPLIAQESSSAPVSIPTEKRPSAPDSGRDSRQASAPHLVRQANRLLLDDKPTEALGEYEKAETLRPDAREIAFGEGLAHYKLGEYDKARDEFNRASGGAADALADDALYSLGTCDHAEALAAQDPKTAVSKLESAMRGYQNLLAHRPDHPAARDANLKAASYWRQLKQQLQQQQQQQQNSDQDKDQYQDDQQQQEQDSKQSDDQQDQKDQQQKQDESQQQQSQQQDSQQKKEQQEQKQQPSADEKQQQNEEQMEQQQAEQKDDSREQAERKLREMMQALRDRKKLRREEVKTPAYRPSEKDW